MDWIKITLDNDAYEVAVDDGCLAIRAFLPDGDPDRTPSAWISAKMCDFIGKEGRKIIESGVSAFFKPLYEKDQEAPHRKQPPAQPDQRAVDEQRRDPGWAK